MMKLNNGDLENDWGLFVVLDEEENKQVNYKKMLLKNIIKIETIEEGECEEEYDPEESYGNKFEYYRNNLGGNRYREEEYQHGEQEDHDEEQEDYKNIVKEKIQFLLTYMFTASVSMALIILTFTI